MSKIPSASASKKTSAKSPAKAKPNPAKRNSVVVNRKVSPDYKTGMVGYKLPPNMDVVTKTLRLKPAFDRGLLILKDILKKPVNAMVNEAVGEYIERRTAQVESDLTTTLEELQAYRRSDPEFAVARAAFVDAEAKYGHEDPMEGRVVQVERPADAPAPQRFVSRARSEAAKAATSRSAVGARQRA